jgi:hypothetical protein
MKCVFCGAPYNSSVGCCDRAAMASALTALQYHTECDHEEVLEAVKQLKDRLQSHGE